jgi:putative DNA primase/helicase
VSVSHLAPTHRDLLIAAAIDLKVADEAAVRSVDAASELPDELATWRGYPGAAPGILFPLDGAGADSSMLYRPDGPLQVDGEEQPRVYLVPEGVRPVLCIHPVMRDRVRTANTIVVVEGAKQHLAAVSCSGPKDLVVGLTDHLSWRSDGVPLDDWNHLPIENSEVIVALDADVATCPEVWGAGSALADHLGVLGAHSVSFLRCPAGGAPGLDVYLGSIAEARRAPALQHLIERAVPLPKAPPKSKPRPGTQGSNRFIASRWSEPKSLAAELRRNGHHALGPDEAIWTYDPCTGVFVDDELALISASSKILGDHYRMGYHRTALELLAAELAEEGLRLPEAPIGKLVTVGNGMLDVKSGILHPHDPSHLAFARLSVDWDPNATCPAFDRWLASRCGTQAEDLLETLGLLLVPWVGPRKVPFLFGPSRSGKSTLMRVVESMIPPQHRSAVTLQDLGRDRFAAAQLHGKILNSAGDLSDVHIGDLSIFKTLTGDDTVSAEHKFRNRFVFRNAALLWFSANALPTVDESSNAYLNRIRPFEFPNSFEGHEDSSFEGELLGELPGILVRLVKGAQRWIKRNGYSPVNPLVADRFAQQSDPVRMFIAQELHPDAGRFLSTTQAYQQYRAWSHQNNRLPLGRNKLLPQLDDHLGRRQREQPNGSGPRGWRDWSFRPDEELPDFMWPTSDLG